MDDRNQKPVWRKEEGWPQCWPFWRTWKHWISYNASKKHWVVLLCHSPQHRQESLSGAASATRSHNDRLETDGGRVRDTLMVAPMISSQRQQCCYILQPITNPSEVKEFQTFWAKRTSAGAATCLHPFWSPIDLPESLRAQFELRPLAAATCPLGVTDLLTLAGCRRGFRFLSGR